ncbi:MAG TPA: aminotransferase class III-fold pyridoxal phosphate-dependent enzyme [Gemmatimonadales bacterium]
MIPGETSTGSKRTEAMFGGPGGPARMVRAVGCRVWDDAGREYLDTTMALGAVALGYAHPAVVAAVERAARDGTVGPLPPTAEAELAERLLEWVPGAEAVRFLKTGAEAVAAAVRIARVVTGRERVVTCGYHGWLDWNQQDPGVPESVRRLCTRLPFGDVSAVEALESAALLPAAIVVEPVIDRPPPVAWLAALRATASRTGAVLVFDEIKTGIRLGPGGAAARYGGEPDLVVLGKALGNGFPLAAVLGPEAIMQAATRTWISSTLATEYVSLAAAGAVLDVCQREDVATTLARAGRRFQRGLEGIVTRHPDVAVAVRGIPEFCYLVFADEAVSSRVALEAVRRGLLFKRSAYNFVSLAHDREIIDDVLNRLENAVAAVE